jgi:hypothetical protein
MEEKRRREIALKIWLDSGIEYDPDNLERLFGNVQKQTGITVEDLKEFTRYILADAYGLKLQQNKLSEEKLGEIAYTLLKAKYERKGISLSPDAHGRAIVALAKATGISFEELKEFSKDIYSEVYAKFLGQHQSDEG